MAIIIRHVETDARFILLGGGFGAYRSSVPDPLTGIWSPHVDSGEVHAVLVCDFKGHTVWMKSAEIEVVSVDGVSPREVLAAEA